MDIFLDTVNRRLASPLGGPPQNSEIPVFPYSTEVPVILHLVADGQNTPSAILGEGWTANAGISTTDDETDQPEMWAPSDSVAVDPEAQTLAFDANCETVPFKAAITGKGEPVQAWFGIKLYAPGATKPSYSYRVRVYLDNIVYDEGVEPPDEPTSDYYTKSEVSALVAGKADSHPLRTDIGRDLVDEDNLFVGFGLIAACSRLYAYIVGKLVSAYGILTTAQKTALTGGPETDADGQHTHAGLARPRVKQDAEAAPTAGDDSADGYSPGSVWIDVANNAAYVCLDATEGAAIWQEIIPEPDLSPVEARIGGLEDIDAAIAPAGTTVLGLVYRRTASGWQAAAPSDLLCEANLLWIALGTDPEVDGMRNRAVVVNEAWSWSGIPGTPVFLAAAGAMTETAPTEEDRAGRFVRQVGWVESATSVRFDGTLQSVYYEELAS